MIESYAFLVAFVVQILTLSVVNPAVLARYVRGWETNFASERVAQLYPGLDYSRWAERFATRFRAANIVVALLGVLLLSRMYNLTRQPDWAGDVSKLTVMYFFLQMSPFLLLVLYSVVRHHKALKQILQRSQEAKRTATLQRRGLFDFVSPSIVILAVASYVLFIPFAIYVDLHVYQNASLSKYCYSAVGSATLVYALNAFIIYKYLYGRKNPLVNQAGRVHTMGMTVKSSVYGSIATVWFISIMSFVTKLQLENWSPFALSIFLVICALLGFMGVIAAPRKPKVDGRASSEATPGAVERLD